MRDALRDAGLEPGQIDYINAHASSTQLNDANESACIRSVFGDHADRLPVSGTKSYTAHPLGATGAIEGALCALAMERGHIPPTLNWQEPDPSCALDVVPNHGRARRLRYVMSNAFGFGGINSCAVLGGIEG
jgi:3-oxoacyl-[acyl-carrier-protein] synthase II